MLHCERDFLTICGRPESVVLSKTTALVSGERIFTTVARLRESAVTSMSPHNDTELHTESVEFQLRTTWTRGVYPLVMSSKKERM